MPNPDAPSNLDAIDARPTPRRHGHFSAPGTSAGTVSIAPIAKTGALKCPCRSARLAARARVASGTLSVLLALTAFASSPARAQPAPATRPTPEAAPGDEADEAADEAVLRGFDASPFRRDDRDDRDERGGPDRGGRERGHGDRGDDRRGPSADAPPSAEDVAAAEAFFAEHAPHRHAFYRRVLERRGEASPVVAIARRRMVDGHRRMEKVRADRPSLHAFLLEQVTLNDAVDQAARDLRAAPDDPVKRDALRSLVRQRLDAILDARSQRVDRLAADLDRERQALADDRDRADEIVDKSVRRLAEGEE